MAKWTLGDIREKVRHITGRFSPDEISNVQLDKFINDYYQLTFPQEVKLESKETFYEFLTQPNQSYYPQPLELYSSFSPQAYCNNFPLIWYQDPNIFYQESRFQYIFKTPWIGDGVTTTFSYQISGFPIMPATLTISSLQEVFEDKNTAWSNDNVNILGSQNGLAVINYALGTIEVTFYQAPKNLEPIHVNYVLFSPRRPLSILCFNNQFQLFPVPDQVYKIRMQASQIVKPMILSSDTPELNEWGLCIAYGAAREIFSSFGEMEAYAEISVLYQEQVKYILKRTLMQLMNERSYPLF